jgi:hypothetical protein
VKKYFEQLTSPVLRNRFDAQLNERFRVIQVPIEINRIQYRLLMMMLLMRNKLMLHILSADVCEINILIDSIWISHDLR